MAKLLVDTSVWIDFFRGRLDTPLLEALTEGISQGWVVLSDIIRHEILVGAQSRRDYQRLRRLLGALECFRIQDDELENFDEFAWRLSQKGLKGKYTDVSIAYLSFRHKIPILSFDRYFLLLSQRGVIPSLIKS